MANPQAANEGQILYGCVASWDGAKRILAEYSSKADSGNTSASVVAEEIVPNLDAPSDAPAQCSKYQNTKIYYTFYEEGFAVCHVCTEDYKVQLSLLFQQDVADAFVNGGFNASDDCSGFASKIQDEVIRYTKDPPKTKFDLVADKQNQIKEVLTNNIEAVVKRHGQIEITLDQTESLKETSRQFSASSKKVKQTAQYQLYKQYASFAAVILCGVGILIIVICVAAKC